MSSVSLRRWVVLRWDREVKTREGKRVCHPGIRLNPLAHRETWIPAQATNPEDLSPFTAINLQYTKNLTQEKYPFTQKVHGLSPLWTLVTAGFIFMLVTKKKERSGIRSTSILLWKCSLRCIYNLKTAFDSREQTARMLHSMKLSENPGGNGLTCPSPCIAFSSILVVASLLSPTL